MVACTPSYEKVSEGSDVREYIKVVRAAVLRAPDTTARHASLNALELYHSYEDRFGSSGAARRGWLRIECVFGEKGLWIFRGKVFWPPRAAAPEATA